MIDQDDNFQYQWVKRYSPQGEQVISCHRLRTCRLPYLLIPLNEMKLKLFSEDSHSFHVWRSYVILQGTDQQCFGVESLTIVSQRVLSLGSRPCQNKLLVVWRLHNTGRAMYTSYMSSDNLRPFIYLLIALTQSGLQIPQISVIQT